MCWWKFPHIFCHFPRWPPKKLVNDAYEPSFVGSLSSFISWFCWGFRMISSTFWYNSNDVAHTSHPKLIHILGRGEVVIVVLSKVVGVAFPAFKVSFWRQLFGGLTCHYSTGMFIMFSCGKQSHLAIFRRKYPFYDWSFILFKIWLFMI